MNIKRILTIVLCTLLAAILVLGGILLSKVWPLLSSGSFSSTAEPTEPTSPTVPSETPTEPEATEHVHEYVLSDTTNATCTGYGWKVYTCKTCGISHMPTEERVDPLGHNYEERTVTEATCTEAAVIERTCTRCGHQDTSVNQENKPLGHNWGHGQVYVATCEEGGYTEFVCMRCNLVEKRDQTEPLGHQFENAVAFPATCTEDAYTLELCSRPGCGGENKIIEENTAIGHTPDSWHTLDTGEFVQFCTTCLAPLMEDADSSKTYDILINQQQVHADPSGEGVAYISHELTIGVSGDASAKPFHYTVNDYLCNDSLVLTYQQGIGLVITYTDQENVSHSYYIDHAASLTITIPLTGAPTIE